MAINPDEDTEFNDALRKHGILPPRPPAPRTPSPPPPPQLEDKLEGLTLSELRELGEDANDAETARMIEHFRRKRLGELKRLEQAPFGRVYPIARDDYTREVTEASKADANGGESEGKGTGVVCFLYKDGLPRSERAFQHVRILAQRHPHTKFVSIVGDKCIPDIPDARLPMFIIYRDGDVRNQIVAWGGDRERQIEELEAVLILAGAVIPQKRPPKERENSSDEEDEDEEDEDDEPSSRVRSGSTWTNTRSKNIRSSKKDEDSDSDFDL